METDISKKWLADMPQQFQNKERIQVVVEAFSRQLDELNKLFADLNIVTNISDAQGEQLDMIGDIVNISRKEAAVLIYNADTNQLADDVYRKVLVYQSKKASASCTYDEIMDTASILMNATQLTYNEIQPAGIKIDINDMQLDDNTSLGRILTLKPAGVALKYDVNYMMDVDFQAMNDVRLTNININMPNDYFNLLRLDGSFLLDGSQTLDHTYVANIEVRTEE